MGLLKILNNTFGKKQIAKKGISDVFEVPNYGDKVPPTKRTSEYLGEMSGWTHSCVTAISDSVASVEVKLYKYKPNGDTKEIFTHPILDILYKVNNFTTKFDHFWLTQAYLEMTGECPWYLEKVNGIITGIFILRPDRLTILYDKQNLVGGYEYSVSRNDYGKSEVILLRPDEIVFLKVPNPNNVYRGQGTLQAVARTINIDEFAETWNENFFYNSARPDGILTVKMKRMNPEQIDKLKASLKVSHTGLQNSHKTMILSGDMDYKQVSLSQADMEFMEQQKFSRDKILGVFRVPKAIVSQTDDVNYASAKTAENIFAKYTIKPKLERIFSQLNEFLLPMYPDGDTLFLDYESPVKEDQEENNARYHSGINNGYMTINEIREKENLVSIKGDIGNQVFLPSGLVAVGATDKIIVPKEENEVIEPEESLKKMNPERLKAFKARTKKTRTLDSVRLEIRKMVKESLIKKQTLKVLEEEDVDPALEIKKLFWNTVIKTADESEDAMEKVFVKIFASQEKKILKSLPKKAIKKESILLNEKIEVAIGVKEVTPIIEKLIAEQGATAIGLVDDVVFDDKDTIILQYIKKRPATFVLGVTQTTNNIIKDILTKGIKEGLGMDEISKLISEKFTSFTKNRTKQIARSEVIRASNFASEQAYSQSGVVEYKEWLTAFDERTCPRCAEMNGKKKKLGDNFFKKGDVFQDIPLDYEDIGFPPLHVNCRCALIPVVSEKSLKTNIEKKKVEKIKNEITLKTKKEIEKLKADMKNSVDNSLKKVSKTNDELLSNNEKIKKSIVDSHKDFEETKKKLEKENEKSKKELQEEIVGIKKVRNKIQTIINEDDKEN